jgi:cytochrome P450
MKISVWATTLHLSLRFPLLRPFVFLLFPPSLTTLIPRLLRMNREEMRRRITQKDELSHPDLFQYLMPEDGKIEPDEEWLLSHANVLMVAGFDPHANLFSSIFYFLSKNRDKLQLAVEEIRKSFESYDEISSDALQNLKYLQAVIDESLRIHTNAAFGLPRVCPEGAVVDGCVVPPGVSYPLLAYDVTK